MDGFYDQQVPYMVTNVSDQFKVGVYKLDSELFLWGSFTDTVSALLRLYGRLFIWELCLQDEPIFLVIAIKHRVLLKTVLG